MDTNGAGAPTVRCQRCLSDEEPVGLCNVPRLEGGEWTALCGECFLEATADAYEQ